MEKESLEQRCQRIFGKSLDEMIPALFDEEKSIHGVAVRLEAFPNAIRYWLDTHDYVATSERVLTLKKVEPHA